MVERIAAGAHRTGIRCAVILCLLAVVATLLATGLAASADRSRQGPWDAYPLIPATEGPKGAAATADDPGSGSASSELSTGGSDDVEQLVVGSFLALIAGGLTMWWLASQRWPRVRVAPAGPPDAAPVRSSAPSLWLHRAVAPVRFPDDPPQVRESVEDALANERRTSERLRDELAAATEAAAIKDAELAEMRAELDEARRRIASAREALHD